MEKFRVPQRKVPVRVRLLDGRDLEGVLFTAATGPDGTPGRVVDRLNDEHERFLALVGPEQSHLLHKSAIVAIHIDAENGAHEIHDAEHATEVRVELLLEGGLVLDGIISYTMPPEKSRILDYLNAVPEFAPLVGSDETTLFNRERVIRVTDQNEAK